MQFRTLVVGLGCSVVALGCELFPPFFGSDPIVGDLGPGGGGGETWINVYSHQITDGEPSNIGNSCQRTESGTGTSVLGSNDEDGFWVEEESNNDGLVIRAHVGDKVIDEHSYDLAFFESGALDRFVLTAPNGDEFSYSVWGANDCEQCPSQEYEPLPGDQFCGQSSQTDAGTDGYANDE